MNFVVAIVIGAGIGLVGWFLVRAKQASAIWIAPLAGVIGAVVASAIATAVSEPGYGPKEIALQVALAAVAVGGFAFMVMRKPAGSE